MRHIINTIAYLLLVNPYTKILKNSSMTDTNKNIAKSPSRKKKFRDTTVTLAHGSGGQAMRDLIDDIFVGSFGNPALADLEDGVSFPIQSLAQLGDRLTFTTDSFVVDPLFFPGGDIGTLAVNGTVNDLAVSGATPLYLSCSVIVEEGLAVDSLRKVAASIQQAAEAANVQIVTGDTKVVPKGSADKLFLNTAGIGMVREGINVKSDRLQPGDAILVNGPLGDHGTAILIARGELALDTNVASDCQPLHGLVDTIINACPQVKAMRDATRGGVATVLNEFATASGVGIRLQESQVPIREEVKGVCEILGFDPLYLANEGKLVVAVPQEAAETVLAAMQSHPAGQESKMIGEVVEAAAGVVWMQTGFGSERVVDMLVGEQLPRIC